MEENRSYNGSTLSISIKSIKTADGSQTQMTVLESVEAVCKHLHTGKEIKKYFYSPSGVKPEGYTDFHLSSDNLVITATLSEADTKDLDEGVYDLWITFKQADERFESGFSCVEKRAYWFTIKKK